MGLAADRGVTICFADLDGADGLWVPEERTILVSRRLSEQRVNEVIEHELAHVAIDDQHAELDAGVWRRPARLSAAVRSKRWAAPALTAAAFTALVGGVTLGLTAARPDRTGLEITRPTQSPVTETGPREPVPGTTVVQVVDSEGRTAYVTVTVTPSVPASPTMPVGSGSRPAPATPVPTRPAGPTTPPGGATTTAAPPDTTLSASPDKPPPTTEVTTVAPTDDVSLEPPVGGTG